MKDPSTPTGIITTTFAVFSRIVASLRALIVNAEAQILRSCDYLESFLPGMRAMNPRRASVTRSAEKDLL
jgi:hypothetical protein